MESTEITKPVYSFSFSHKVCPICKESKPIEEYHIYFSKQRQKHRIANYCKVCARVDSKPRAQSLYQRKTEERKQYAKDYRANPDNKEKLKVLSQKFKQKYRDELQDCYVRDRLHRDNNIPVEISKELPEIVETKRLQIKIRRKIKTLKDGKK